MAYKITDDTHYSNIADAIRDKLGSNELFMPGEMADAIESIETGGGGEPDTFEKTVFCDYDGTVLYAYTVEEISALNSLPDLPEHSGLVAQGWNWSLADLKALGREAVVGAHYVTDDGKTRAYFHVRDDELTVMTNYKQYYDEHPVLVDWGDGSPKESFEGVTASLEHTYAEGGDYVVTYEVVEDTGSLIFYGSNYFNSGLMVTTQDYLNTTFGANVLIKKIEFGNRVVLNNNAMRAHVQLETISVPVDMEISSSTSAFLNTCKLKFMVLPNGVTALGQDFASGCRSLKGIAFPKTVTQIGNNSFRDCVNLKLVTIPEGITAISQYAFANCRSIEKFSIPNSLTTISKYAFQNAMSLRKVSCGNTNLKTIDTYAFSGCISLEEIDFGNSLTSLGKYAMADCAQVRTLVVPSGVKDVVDNTFNSMEHLREIVFMGAMTRISGNNIFSDCHIVECYDFSHCTSVPPMADTNSLMVSNDTVIKVPAVLENDFKTASVWSEYADHIVGV